MTTVVSSPTLPTVNSSSAEAAKHLAAWPLPDLSVQEARILTHFSEAEHFGRTALVDGMVSLIGKRAGISLVLAQVAIGQMDALVQAGHLVREGQGEGLIYKRASQALPLVSAATAETRTEGRNIKGTSPNKRIIKRKTGQDNSLLWLASRRDKAGQALISPTALAAGERLQRDFLLAGLSPKMTSDWSGLPMSGDGRKAGQLLQTESQIAARQRLRRALAACGSDYANLLLDLCCFQKPLELVEKQRGWPARSGKVVLGMALSALMRHYGLSEMARGQAPRGKGQETIHIWHAPDSDGP